MFVNLVPKVLPPVSNLCSVNLKENFKIGRSVFETLSPEKTRNCHLYPPCELGEMKKRNSDVKLNLSEDSYNVYAPRYHYLLPRRIQDNRFSQRYFMLVESL